MSVFQAIVLGIIQGITEFLPVSSSGHLILVPKLLGWADQGLAFDTIMHLGTLGAVVLFFRKKIWEILAAAVSSDKEKKMQRRLGFFLLLSIIPAALVGFFFDEYVSSVLRSPLVVASSLLFWGVALILADRYQKHRQKHGVKETRLDNISRGQASCIALAQAIALIPGTSRSGVTMTTGLFAGLGKVAAAEFSFLMSIPIILIAGAAKVKDLLNESVPIETLPLFIGFVSALFSGFFAIWFLLRIIERWSFVPFGVYRIIVGIVVIVAFM